MFLLFMLLNSNQFCIAILADLFLIALVFWCTTPRVYSSLFHFTLMETEKVNPLFL